MRGIVHHRQVLDAAPFGGTVKHKVRFVRECASDAGRGGTLTLDL